MTLVEVIARSLCRSLWGDPDERVIRTVPLEGPGNKLSVVLKGAEIMAAWEFYQDAARQLREELIDCKVIDPDTELSVIDELENMTDVTDQIVEGLAQAENWRGKRGLM